MGGALHSLEEHLECTFASVLGWATNNQAEIWELWKGLELARAREINSLMILGDSIVVIYQVSKVTLGPHPNFPFYTLYKE